MVRSIHDGTWVEDQPRHGGRRYNDQGTTAVIEIEGPILLVVNSLRTPPFSLGQTTSLGIEPARQAIIVVKAAVAYKAAYGPIAGRRDRGGHPWTHRHRPGAVSLSAGTAGEGDRVAVKWEVESGCLPL